MKMRTLHSLLISFQILYITPDIFPTTLEWQLEWNSIHCSKVGRRWIFDRSQRPQTHQFRDIIVNIVPQRQSSQCCSSQRCQSPFGEINTNFDCLYSRRNGLEEQNVVRDFAPNLRPVFE